MRGHGIWVGALGLAFLALAAGCGDQHAQVSGSVLADGQPLQEGEIIFEEADQSQTPAAAKIVDGKYTIQMPPGSKKVRITASVPTSKPDPVMGAAAREMIIPPEFNEQTRLTAKIQRGKQEGVDFEVKTFRKRSR